jgi:predicted AAA+ superfamily ATPase
MEFAAFSFIQTWEDLAALIAEYKAHFNITDKYWLFIDEIQQIDGWEKLINSLSQDYTQEVDIHITGSNSQMLSSELSTLLSGRYVQFEIFPFSYEEFLQAEKAEASRKSYLKYIESGGLPELLNLKNDESRRNYLSALRDTVMLRDIVQRYQIKDPLLLNDLFTYVSNNISNPMSINNLIGFFQSKKRRTSYDTISNYLEYITHAFLAHKCTRFDVRGKEILGGVNKFYLNDLAFKNYLFPGTQHGYGYLLENAVYLALRRGGYDTYTGHLRDKEIDFVAKKNGALKYFQVAFNIQDAETLAREKRALLAVPDNYPKYIVTLDESPATNIDGIPIVQAWDLNAVLLD